MTFEIIAFILWNMAAVSNSVMDKITHHFSTSIFKNLRRQYWDPAVSWRNKYENYASSQTDAENFPDEQIRKQWFGIDVPVVFTDAWHLFKTIMIFCICGSIALQVYCEPKLDLMWYAVIKFIVYGLSWNRTFSLFYDHILKT